MAALPTGNREATSGLLVFGVLLLLSPPSSSGDEERAEMDEMSNESQSDPVDVAKDATLSRPLVVVAEVDVGVDCFLWTRLVACCNKTW